MMCTSACRSRPALIIGLAAGLAFVAGTAVALAQPKAATSATPPTAAPTAAPAAEAKKLSVGDKAPPISIEHWVKGDKVSGFEPGKIYVVEFWATWCGPCIKNMPHLTKLQKEYKDKGVTIIGVSSQDRRGIEDVRPFVERRGDVIGYTIAVDKDMETAKAYMFATGQQSIPAAYIVDKKGNLAWYGHPMDGMDLVLSELVADTFDAGKHAERIAKHKELAEQFSASAGGAKWDEALATLDEITKNRPDLSKQAELSRFAVLRIGKKDAAAAATQRDKLLGTTLKDDPEMLRALTETIMSVPEPTDADRAGAVEAARAVVAATQSKDAQGLSLLARAHKAAGQMDKAIETQTLAVAAAGENEGLKQTMQSILDEMKTAAAASAKTDAPAKSDK